MEGFIVVVKRRLGYSNVLFYNHLYHPCVFRNLFFKVVGSGQWSWGRQGRWIVGWVVGSWGRRGGRRGVGPR